MTEVKQYERPYYYNNQLRRLIVQFMAVFNGFQVMIGWNETKESRLIPVPIANASKDRVVAWIKNNQTQNKMIRLPMFSATLMSIDLAPELRKGIAVQRRSAMMPTGGLFPDDIKVIQQRQPVPYLARFELGIWASNQDQHYQLMEQITSLFDPTLSLQTSDDVYDLTRLTTLELTNIRMEENVPAGLDRRIIQTFLEFQVPVYISLPADVHKRFVEEIYVRIGLIGSDTTVPADIVETFDEEGLQYEKVFDLHDIDIEGNLS